MDASIAEICERFEGRMDAAIADTRKHFERDIEGLTERKRAEYKAEKKAEQEATRRVNLVRAAARGDTDAVAELEGELRAVRKKPILRTAS
jgi:hypothetical protein